MKPLAWHQRRWDDGRTLLRTPLAEPVEAAFGSPHYQMHRADLLAALAGAVPAERLHLGHRLIGLERPRRPGRGAVRERRPRREFDALVGADGIHSPVRARAVRRRQPRFTGCVAYRGLVPADRLRDLALEVTAQVWMGPRAAFRALLRQRPSLVNFVAIVEQDTWTRESWTDRGEVADALAAFEGWHPQVRTILGSVDETFVWALFDRPPLERWSVGRVTLLGDACHAMLPFMAQGAAQAIEDGATLAACLGDAGPTSAAALRRYEPVRIPRTSRAAGDVGQQQDPLPSRRRPRAAARDAEMASGSTDWSFRAVAWIYGHDAAKV